MYQEPKKNDRLQTRIPNELRLVVRHIARKEHRSEASMIREFLIEGARRCARRDPFVRKHLSEVELTGDDGA